jgi:hypothetical protein
MREESDWKDRPVLAQTRVLMRLDRMLVSAALYAGSAPYGEPLWDSRWVLPVRRRDHRDASAGALWWITQAALSNHDPAQFLTRREWADEMARIRKL